MIPALNAFAMITGTKEVLSIAVPADK